MQEEEGEEEKEEEKEEGEECPPRAVKVTQPSPLFSSPLLDVGDPQSIGELKYFLNSLTFKNNPSTWPGRWEGTLLYLNVVCRDNLRCNCY